MVNMFFPSFFFTLVLALHCVYARTIFRLGSASQAVTSIRDDIDFKIPGADGNVPADATKGLSVSTNIIAPKDAPGVAQLIANANAATGADKATLQKKVKDALSGLRPKVNPNGVWQADFSAATFTGFALVSAPNSDPGHSLVTVTTPIPRATIQNTLNAKFTKVPADTVFNMILALGGNPKAQVAPAANAGSAGAPAAAPAKPATPAAQPAAAPVKPATPVIPPVVPAKPAAPAGPVVPKPATPVVAPVAPKPAAPKPVVAKPKPGKPGKAREEPLRMRRVRRALA
ncbi:hypothetical protein DL96DRAFT_1678216 [Flagelloscypha sp. PMI_526]|nr:hypothetical protein DL96DRAFT_1678216 [Flagelloscypha sp. PMI_526]